MAHPARIILYIIYIAENKIPKNKRDYMIFIKHNKSFYKLTVHGL